MKLQIKRTIAFIAMAAMVLISTTAVAADAPQRVLILPFNIHAEQDLTFLENGILDMLSTRLTLAGKTITIPKEDARRAIENMPKPIGENAAILLGASLGANYVVLGSLTVFGTSISTDARFLDVIQQKPVVTFNQFGRDPGDVIAHVNQFAGQVGEDVFGIVSRHAQQPNTAASASPHPVQPPSVSSRTHPETVFNQTFGGGGGIMMTGEEPSGRGRLMLPAWKSRNFPIQIKGMAVGDVDGDGKKETVFIEDQTVHIYRLAESKFTKIKEISGNRVDSYVSVDAADINGNGIAEIYVTCLSETSGSLKSFILEYNGTDFGLIAENQRFYFRVIEDSHRGRLLLGQKQNVKEIFGQTIYEMKWVGSSLEPDSPRSAPKGVNVYGVTYADVLNNGGEMIVASDKNEHLGIFQPNGSEEWVSEEPFGGSTTYLEPPPENTSRSGRHHGDPYAEKRIYLPQRIFVRDLDQDGKNEVIAVQNKDAGDRLLSRSRIFRSGNIKCFQWETMGLYEKWRVRKVSGHISDFAIADFDNDGEDEIVFAVVVKEESGIGQGKSYIAAQELK
ncbi:MAG: VCBS repeat-containing protein [Desulfobacterales bacterium]|nr:VCBS repeat-containing protein [Desulfobacterales bacterium]